MAKARRKRSTKSTQSQPVEDSSYGVRQRTQVEIANDRLRISRMIRRGWDEEKVAGELNLSVGQVRDDLQWVLKDMAETRRLISVDIIEMKLVEYAEVKAELWDQWERSKNPIEREAYETVTNPDGSVREIVKRFRDGRLGSSEHMRLILECLKAERELLGLNPDKKLRLSGNVGLGPSEGFWDSFFEAVNNPNLDQEAEERIYEGLPRIEVKNEAKEE